MKTFYIWIVLEIYADQLISEGVVTAEEVKEVKDKYEKICEDAYNQAKQETHIKYKDWLDSPWSGFFEGKDPLKVNLNKWICFILLEIESLNQRLNCL